MFFLRDENIKLSAEQKDKLARVDALLGGAMLISDDPAGYSPAARAQYRSLLKLRQAEHIRIKADDALTIAYTLNGAQGRVIVSGPPWPSGGSRRSLTGN